MRVVRGEGRDEVEVRVTAPQFRTDRQASVMQSPYV